MSCYQLTSVLLVLTLVMYIQNSCSYLQRTRLTPTITTQTTTASVTGTAILIDRTNTKIHLTNRLLMSKVDNVQTPESVYLPAIPGNIMTLSRFMIEATRANPDHADFESLIASIQIACKSISNLLSRSGVSELIGGNSLTAVELSEIKSKDRGEVLYEAANTVLKNALRFTGKLGIIAAESEPHPLLIEEAWNSNYIAVFDPLDGSTNIDVGIVTGTIFGIFKESDECLMDFGEEIANEDRKACILKNLQPKNLVAAGYCMYSSSTVLMFSMGDGLHGFTLDPLIGEFVLTHPNVRIPRRGRTYSFNEAREQWWPNGLQEYIGKIKRGKGETESTYSARYIGSMVGDIHRTLLNGGIFGYPGDSKSKNGKLRLLYESAPIAYLIEQAGGKASTGSGRLLDVVPESIHEHVSTILGSYDDVVELEKYLANNDATESK